MVQNCRPWAWGLFLSEFRDVPRKIGPQLAYVGERQKGDGGKGTGQKASRQFARNVTTTYDILRQFATFYDNFRLFVPLT